MAINTDKLFDTMVQKIFYPEKDIDIEKRIESMELKVNVIRMPSVCTQDYTIRCRKPEKPKIWKCKQ